MALALKYFNTSAGKQPAIVDLDANDSATTLVVVSETDADGLTAGQLAFKHGVPKGTEPGTWTD